MKAVIFSSSRRRCASTSATSAFRFIAAVDSRQFQSRRGGIAKSHANGKARGRRAREIQREARGTSSRAGGPRPLSSGEPCPFGPAVDPVIFTSAKTHAAGETRRFHREGGRRRGRRRDPRPLEGTVDPGGLDVPAPPRARLGRVKVGFCFLPAPASDKRAALAYERAAPRPDGDGPCRARITAPTVLTSAGSATPAVEWGPIGRPPIAR